MLLNNLRISINSIIFFQRARQLKTKRDEATDAYKAGRFQEAFDLYSTALSIDPSNKTILAKLYCSRATVLAKVSSSYLVPPYFTANNRGFKRVIISNLHCSVKQFRFVKDKKSHILFYTYICTTILSFECLHLGLPKSQFEF